MLYLLHLYAGDSIQVLIIILLHALSTACLYDYKAVAIYVHVVKDAQLCDLGFFTLESCL